jgi:hypothetical protein
VGPPPNSAELPAHVARLRDGLYPPEALSGLRIVGVEEAIQRALARCDSDDDLVPHHQRCMRDGETFLVFVHCDIEDYPARLGVERDQMRVERAQIQAVAQNGEAAVCRDRAVGVILGQRPGVAPDGRARSGIERGGVVARAGNEHHAIHHQRRDLDVRAAELERPLRG